MMGALLTNLLMVLGLSLLAFLLTRVVRRPALLHGFWLLVLLRLFVPPVLLVQCLPESWVRAFPRPVPVYEESVAMSIQAPSAVLRERTAGSSPPEPAGNLSWWMTLGALWLAGSLAVVLLSVLRLRRFRRVLALAEPAGDDLDQLVGSLARRLGLKQVPGVYLVPGRFPPMVWARPGARELILPSRLLSELSRPELETLLVHELAHVRRRDHLVRLVELLAGIVFWWYPVVWWVRRRLRHYEELCCDGWVLQVLPEARRAYADALLKTLELINGKTQPLPGIACGLGHLQGIEERIRMIMKNRGHLAWTRGQRWSLIAAALVVLGVSPTWGGGQQVVVVREVGSSQQTGLEKELQEIREQSQALQGQLKELQKRRQELEWESRKLETQNRIEQLRAEVERLNQAGNQQDAAMVEENLRLLDRQLYLQDRLQALQRDRSAQVLERQTALERTVREARRLSGEGRNEEAAALKQQGATLERQLAEEVQDFEQNSLQFRRELEEVSAELRQNQVERLRFLGQQEEADALERGLKERVEVRQIREEAVAEGSLRRRQVETELESLLVEIRELEAVGETQKAEELRHRLEARKRVISEESKKPGSGGGTIKKRPR